MLQLREHPLPEVPPLISEVLARRRGRGSGQKGEVGSLLGDEARGKLRCSGRFSAQKRGESAGAMGCNKCSHLECARHERLDPNAMTVLPHRKRSAFTGRTRGNNGGTTRNACDVCDTSGAQISSTNLRKILHLISCKALTVPLFALLRHGARSNTK